MNTIWCPSARNVVGRRRQAHCPHPQDLARCSPQDYDLMMMYLGARGGHGHFNGRLAQQMWAHHTGWWASGPTLASRASQIRLRWENRGVPIPTRDQVLATYAGPNLPHGTVYAQMPAGQMVQHAPHPPPQPPLHLPMLAPAPYMLSPAPPTLPPPSTQAPVLPMAAPVGPMIPVAAPVCNPPPAFYYTNVLPIPQPPQNNP